MSPRWLQWLEALALAAFSVTLFEGALLLRQARLGLPPLAAQAGGTLSKLDLALDGVRAIELNTTRTEAEMAGLLNQSRHSMLTVKQETDLVNGAEEVLENANAAVLQIGISAARLGGVAPAVNQAVIRFSDDAHATLQDGQALFAATTADLSDPAIPETLAHLDLTTARAAETMAHADRTAQNISETTKLLEDRVRVVTQPASLTVRIAEKLLGLTTQAAQIAFGFFK